MNKGMFQSSPVQQVMGQSPTCWSMNNLRPRPDQSLSLLPSTSSYPSSSCFPQYPQCSSLLPPGTSPWQDNQKLPESWSQLLLRGSTDQEEEKYGLAANYQLKEEENWEDQVLHQTIKKDYSGTNYEDQVIQASRCQWNQILPAPAAGGSSPGSCITTSFSNNNMFDFSNNCKGAEKRDRKSDKSSECNSTGSGTSFKKARIQGSSSAQSTLKVRKEKLGDRITALHQIVSPFGKTDTASVLLEAIGYIRFLQSQIEVLSSPYLVTGNKRQPKPLSSGRGMKIGVSEAQKDGHEEPKKDLRSRGLCLVPVSLTSHFGCDNGGDFWPPPPLGGGFL